MCFLHRDRVPHIITSSFNPFPIYASILHRDSPIQALASSRSNSRYRAPILSGFFDASLCHCPMETLTLEIRKYFRFGKRKPVCARLHTTNLLDQLRSLEIILHTSVRMCSGEPSPFQCIEQDLDSPKTQLPRVSMHSEIQAGL